VKGLYAIVDVSLTLARGLSVVGYAQALLAAKPCALQLRAKHTSAREQLGLLRELAPLSRSAGVPLVANDRPDLAVLAGCDFVHVGQDDAPIELVRRIAPGLGAGLSTHNMEQLTAALALGPDYVAIGPIFATQTKVNADPVVGLSVLAQAHAAALAHAVPLVAIGGINASNVESVAAHTSAVALVSALLPESNSVTMDEITAQALAFSAKISGASS
jgi:thiamine-phosphate pyrophosphorylase